MEEVEQHEQPLSEYSNTTNEAGSDDDVSGYSINIVEIVAECDLSLGDLMSRYYAVVAYLERKLNEFYERSDDNSFYVIEPVLIARNVNVRVLEDLPPLVGHYRVKCEVQSGDLFVIDLSNGASHGGGVAEIAYQAKAWSQGVFEVTIDGVTSFGGEANGRAPDVVIEVGSVNRQAGVQACCLIIIELEVGNRSIPAMRRDFINYFRDPVLTYRV